MTSSLNTERAPPLSAATYPYGVSGTGSLRSRRTGARQGQPVGHLRDVRPATEMTLADEPSSGTRLPRDGDGPNASRSREAEVSIRSSYLQPLLLEYSRLPGTAARKARLRDRLVTELLPMTRYVARRYAYRGVPIEDLAQLAAVGLIQAIDRYDPGKGPNFPAFAILTMQGEIRRYFRDSAWAIRVPRRLRDLHITLINATADLAQSLGRAPRPSELAAHLGFSTDEVLEALDAGNAYRAQSLDRPLREGSDRIPLAHLLGEPDPALDRVDVHHTLQPLLARLPERERTVVYLRFYANMTQTQIAERFGTSQMYVSRLLVKTLCKLRQQLKDS